MKISMDIELKDIPGQLVSALEPISALGGNIISVIHHRDKKTPSGGILVQLVFDIEERSLEKVIEGLKARNIEVIRVGKERLRESVSAILIGHVVHSDIRELINAVDDTGFAEVTELNLSMPGIDKKTSALIRISAIGGKELEEATEILQEVARRKGIMVILPIETGLK
ncbi:MAG: amino acid-binding protein [Candidatus Methanospirareceae archaeon]